MVILCIEDRIRGNHPEALFVESRGSEWTPLLSKLLLRGARGAAGPSPSPSLTMTDQLGLEDAITHGAPPLLLTTHIPADEHHSFYCNSGSSLQEELGDLYRKEGPVSTSNLTSLYML